MLLDSAFGEPCWNRWNALQEKHAGSAEAPLVVAQHAENGLSALVIIGWRLDVHEDMRQLG